MTSNIINHLNDFLKNYSNIIDTFGILVTFVLTVYIFRFENRQKIKDVLSHKYKLIDKLSELKDQISKGKNWTVAIINVDKYDEYPNTDESYSKYEFKSYFHNGVYFNTGMYFKFPQNKYIPRIGFIPFNNIEYIDLESDGNESCPKFYVKFSKTKNYKAGRKNFKTPFTKWFYAIDPSSDIIQEYKHSLKVRFYVLYILSKILSFKTIISLESFANSLKISVDNLKSLKIANQNKSTQKSNNYKIDKK